MITITLGLTLIIALLVGLFDISRRNDRRKTWKRSQAAVFTAFSLLYLVVALTTLAFERAKFYRPELLVCENSGKRFHCVHGMCHCR